MRASLCLNFVHKPMEAFLAGIFSEIVSKEFHRKRKLLLEAKRKGLYSIYTIYDLPMKVGIRMKALRHTYVQNSH
jgi:hypothetical protein